MQLFPGWVRMVGKQMQKALSGWFFGRCEQNMWGFLDMLKLGYVAARLNVHIIPKTNIFAPEKWCLGDYVFDGKLIFQIVFGLRRMTFSQLRSLSLNGVRLGLVTWMVRVVGSSKVTFNWVFMVSSPTKKVIHPSRIMEVENMCWFKSVFSLAWCFKVCFTNKLGSFSTMTTGEIKISPLFMRVTVLWLSFASCKLVSFLSKLRS